MNKIIALTLSLLILPLSILAQTATPSLSSPLTVPTLTREQQIEIQKLQEQAGKLLSPKSIRRNSISQYLKVQFSPQSPKPGETVRVTAESFLSDLNKATITWSLNGKAIDRGIGKTSFSFKVGVSGATTRLGILIITNQGEEIYKEYGFSPIGLTLLWEADTYTPPFYKGKPLVTYQSRVRAIAVPDAAHTKDAVDASSLAYVWRQDGYAVSDASGYGKNSYTFTAPRPYEKAKISVSATPLTGGAHSEFSLDLPLANPFILFYEEDPLSGVLYERPLANVFTLTQKDVSVRAEPFFFSNERTDAALFSYVWELNGKQVTNPGRTITLKNEKGESGEASLSLGVAGIRKTFQSASQSLRIRFNPEVGATSSF